MLTYRGAGESAPVLPIVRLNGVVRSGGIAPMSSAPPASTAPLVRSQPSSTHTQQQSAVGLAVAWRGPPPPAVVRGGGGGGRPCFFFPLPGGRSPPGGVDFPLRA